MTVNDIGKIALSVGVTQLLADLLSHKLIYQSDHYKKKAATFQRAKEKHEKTAAALASKRRMYEEQKRDQKRNILGKKTSQQISEKSLEKDEKKLKFESDDLTRLADEVVRSHKFATIYASIASLLMFQKLKTEYSGKIVALLPFQPFYLLQKMTFWGLAEAAGVKSSTEFHFQWVKALGAGEDSITKPTSPFPAVPHASQACAFAFIYFLCSMTVKMMIGMIFAVKPPPGADETVATLFERKSKNIMEKFGLAPPA